MKKLICVAAALAMAVSMSGCGTLAALGGSPSPATSSPVVGTVVLDAGKVLGTLDAAIIGAADTAKLAAQTGIIHGATADMVNDYLKRANEAARKAHTAYKAGKDASLLIAEANGWISNVMELAKPGG